MTLSTRFTKSVDRGLEKASNNTPSLQGRNGGICGQPANVLFDVAAILALVLFGDVESVNAVRKEPVAVPRTDFLVPAAKQHKRLVGSLGVQLKIQDRIDDQTV